MFLEATYRAVANPYSPVIRVRTRASAPGRAEVQRASTRCSGKSTATKRGRLIRRLPG